MSRRALEPLVICASFAAFIAASSSCHYFVGTSPCTSDDDCTTGRCDVAFGVCAADDDGEGEAAGEGEGGEGEGGEGEGGEGEGGEGEGGEGEGGEGEGGEGEGEGEGGEGEGEGEGDGPDVVHVFVDNLAGPAATDVPVLMRVPGLIQNAAAVVTDCAGNVVSQIEHQPSTDEFWTRLDLAARAENEFCVVDVTDGQSTEVWREYGYVEHCVLPSAIDASGHVSHTPDVFTSVSAGAYGQQCRFVAAGVVDHTLNDVNRALGLGDGSGFVSFVMRSPIECAAGATVIEGVLSHLLDPSVATAGDWRVDVDNECNPHFRTGGESIAWGDTIDGALHVFSLSIANGVRSVYVDGSLSSADVGSVVDVVPLVGTTYVGADGISGNLDEADGDYDEILFSSRAQPTNEVRYLARTFLDGGTVATTPALRVGPLGPRTGIANGSFTFDQTGLTSAEAGSVTIDVTTATTSGQAPASRVAFVIDNSPWGATVNGANGQARMTISRATTVVFVDVADGPRFSAQVGAEASIAFEVALFDDQLFVWTDPPFDFADDDNNPRAPRALVTGTGGAQRDIDFVADAAGVRFHDLVLRADVTP